jgi:hypothetical protein
MKTYTKCFIVLIFSFFYIHSIAQKNEPMAVQKAIEIVELFKTDQFQKAYKSNLTTMSVSCAPVMKLTISNLSESLIQKRQVQIYQCLECMKMNDSYFVTKWAFCFCFSFCGFSLCFDFDI